MALAFLPIMQDTTLSESDRHTALSKFQLVSGGKGGKQAHRTGHAHMKYVRAAAKRRRK